MNRKAILIASAALLLAACEQMENPVQNGTPVALQYATVDATETKAAQNLNEGTFASGESVTVRISNTGENAWTNYNFTTGSSGAMSPIGTVPYYPAGAQNIDIVAYYPATAGASFTVAADQTSDASYKASDLMFTSVTNQAKQAAAVTLTFAHKMAKLNVNVTAGSGVSSINSVTLLNVKPTVTFDQATGAVGSACGDATSIAISNNGAAVIPAQTIDGGLLSIDTDQGTAIYSVSDKSFAAGQQYTLNITVNLRAVGTTNAITGWTSEGTVTITPVYDNAPGDTKAIDLNITVNGKRILWANMNVGAEAETYYGTYFAWGETGGFSVLGATDSPSDTPPVKTCFLWETYAWCQGTSNKLTKYCPTNQQGSYWWDPSGNGNPADNKTRLDFPDDAARATWGGNWRMPTIDELNALRETKSNSDYTWTWCDGSSTKYNDSTVKGWKIVYNSTNATIFLPCAGFRDHAFFFEQGSRGNYWSSSLEDHPDRAWYLTFDSGSYNVAIGAPERYFGFTVRAVQAI